MNVGVAKAEERKCCDRTDLKKCVANVRRIKQCSKSHAPDANQKNIAAKDKVKIAAEKAAIAAEKTTYVAKVKMEKMGAKAEAHEALSKLHAGLEGAAQAIIDARKASDAANKKRTAGMIADCKKQMADSMAAMKASQQAERKKAQADIMVKMAKKQIVERTEQLKDAEEYRGIQEADLKKWSAKLAVTQSPKGKKDMQKLVDDTNAELKKAQSAVKVARKKLSASKAQLETGDYTELKHMKMKDTKELNSDMTRDMGGNECVTFVQKREDARHKILKDEWESEQKIADKNRKIKEKETLAAVEARNEEAKLRAVYEQANKSSTSKRLAAQKAVVEYQKVATGGKCCAFLQTSAKGANPKVMKEQCCTANGCAYNEAKTVTSHKECSSQGELRKEGCKCHQGWGGIDCSIKLETTACFTGTRGNGETSDNHAACATCYRCSKGGAKKNKAGDVIEAGQDVCGRNAGGKDSLCLSCPPGSGLLRFGDRNKELFKLGYRQAGRCQPYPKLDAAKATHATEDPLSCKEVCFPSRDGFQKKGVMSCTKVCSSWNPIVVQNSNLQVSATALCHVSKDAFCHAKSGKTMANIETDKHTCVAKKALTPQRICYSLAKVDGVSYPGGMGLSCSAGSQGVSGAEHAALTTNHGAGKQWCCYKDVSKLPGWLKSVPAHMWCSAVAMRA